jgi:hypothetical protein
LRGSAALKADFLAFAWAVDLATLLFLPFFAADFAAASWRVDFLTVDFLTVAFFDRAADLAVDAFSAWAAVFFAGAFMLEAFFAAAFFAAAFLAVDFLATAFFAGALLAVPFFTRGAAGAPEPAFALAVDRVDAFLALLAGLPTDSLAVFAALALVLRGACFFMVVLFLVAFTLESTSSS